MYLPAGHLDSGTLEATCSSLMDFFCYIWAPRVPGSGNRPPGQGLRVTLAPWDPASPSQALPLQEFPRRSPLSRSPRATCPCSPSSLVLLPCHNVQPRHPLFHTEEPILYMEAGRSSQKLTFPYGPALLFPPLSATSTDPGPVGDPCRATSLRRKSLLSWPVPWTEQLLNLRPLQVQPCVFSVSARPSWSG